MKKDFTVMIVEDAKLELKGTEEIFRTEIPEAEIIGVAANEKELDLLLSGGSDFHGAAKPGTELGVGKGNLQIPYEWYLALKAQAKL